MTTTTTETVSPGGARTAGAILAGTTAVSAAGTTALIRLFESTRLNADPSGPIVAAAVVSSLVIAGGLFIAWAASEMTDRPAPPPPTHQQYRRSI